MGSVPADIQCILLNGWPLPCEGREREREQVDKGEEEEEEEDFEQYVLYENELKHYCFKLPKNEHGKSKLDELSVISLSK